MAAWTHHTQNILPQGIWNTHKPSQATNATKYTCEKFENKRENENENIV